MNSLTRRYFFGHAVSIGGDWMRWIALGWLIRHEMGFSSDTFGLARTWLALTALAITPVAGNIVRVAAGRRLLLIANAAMALGSLLLAVFSLTNNLTFFSLMVILCYMQVGIAVKSTAEDVFIQRIAGEQLIGANWIKDSLLSIMRIIMGISGGVLLDRFGSAALFACDGFSFVCMFVALWTLPPIETAVEATKPNVGALLFTGVREWMASFRFILTQPGLFWLIILFLINDGFVYTSWVLLPEIVETHLGGSGRDYGMSVGIPGFGGLIGIALCIMAFRFRMVAIWLMPVCWFAQPVAMYFVASSASVRELIFWYAVAFACWVPCLTITRYSLQRSTEPAFALAVFNFALYFGIILNWASSVAIRLSGVGAASGLKYVSLLSLLLLVAAAHRGRIVIGQTLRKSFSPSVSASSIRDTE